MARKKYSLLLFSMSKKRAAIAEEIIRKFIIKNADMLSLTDAYHQRFRPLSFLMNIFEEMPDLDRYRETIERLKQEFIHKSTSGLKFHSYSSKEESKYTHYYYAFVPRIKKMFQSETLVWDCWKSKNFYGLDDPIFYKGKEMIGAVVSHEPSIVLFLTDNEKKKLEKEGIRFSD